MLMLKSLYFYIMCKIKQNIGNSQRNERENNNFYHFTDKKDHEYSKRNPNFRPIFIKTSSYRKRFIV